MRRLLTALALWGSSAGSQPAMSPTEGAAEPPTTARETPAEGAPRPLGAVYDGDQALPARAAQVVQTRLTAALDAEAHRVTARMELTFRNPARVPLRELWVHLYLNAFKNERSLFLRSPFGAHRSGGRARTFGALDVRRWVSRTHGGRDLWPAAEWRLPDDPEDETLARIPLPEPLAPGALLEFSVDFEAQLPGLVERTGFTGSFHMVAQWFPKLARVEADGTWRAFRFHPQAEFHADFGSYDVTLEVPPGFRIGATGACAPLEPLAGRDRWRCEATNVHDFAWTAWDRFRSVEDTVEGVRVTVLHPPGHEENAALTLDTVRRALPSMNRRLGRYPYPTLTVVHPPSSAPAAGGMEYPTLITTGGHWALGRLTASVPVVTVHELLHQWFQGMVATDETRFPFLDEGLTSYVEGVILRELGLWQAPWLGEARRVVGNRRAEAAPVASPAAAFDSFRELGALVYARTASLLETLAGVHGEDRLLLALGRYARAYRYAHPEPRHLLSAIEEVLGHDAREQLALGLFERGTVDYLVRDLECAELREPAGWFDRAGLREHVRAGERGSTGVFACRVVVARLGTLRFPVDVELCDDAGRCWRRRWDGRGNTHVLREDGPRRLVSAVVDPDRVIRVDADRTNDATRRVAASTPRTGLLLTAAAAALLAWLGP